MIPWQALFSHIPSLRGKSLEDLPDVWTWVKFLHKVDSFMCCKTSSSIYVVQLLSTKWWFIREMAFIFWITFKSLLFILKQVFSLFLTPLYLAILFRAYSSKKCWDNQTSHNELTSTIWTHLIQGQLICSQMKNFVQFLPLWSKNLFPSGVHIREISPNYNTTLLGKVLILLETFLGREVHMPPVWISIAVILHF